MASPTLLATGQQDNTTAEREVFPRIRLVRRRATSLPLSRAQTVALTLGRAVEATLAHGSAITLEISHDRAGQLYGGHLDPPATPQMFCFRSIYAEAIS